MKAIPLRSRKYPGLVALVDDEDYERVAAYGWWPHKTKSAKTWYAETKINGRNVLMHKLVTAFSGEVEHRDKNGLNCQQDNLRPASRSQNMGNTEKYAGPKTHSPYKGVSAHHSKTNPWRGHITIDGKYTHLGQFSTPEAAARAYDKAAREVFGDFARTNFKEGE